MKTWSSRLAVGGTGLGAHYTGMWEVLRAVFSAQSVPVVVGDVYMKVKANMKGW